MLFHKKNRNKGPIIKIIASILLISTLFATLISCGDEEPEVVDMLNDDLSKYITLSESDYKNFPVKGDLDEYNDDYLTRKINKIIVENREKHPDNPNETGFRGIAISLGDTVKLRYRGYTLDENGKQIEIPLSCNFADDYDVFASSLRKRGELIVGSGEFLPGSDIDESAKYAIDLGYFIPGIEEALIGKAPKDYGEFFRIESGKPSEGQILYISYYSASESTNKRVSHERLDLSRTDIDSEYGDGFRELLLSSEIGTPIQTNEMFTKGEEKIQYMDLTINFATEFESNPITVDVVLPNNFRIASLRGKEAKFDIYPEYVINYQTKAFDEKFITDTLGVNKSSLSSYDGSDTVEKYKNFLCEEIKAEIAESNKQIILESMWTHYKMKVRIKELPESMVEGYYQSYYNEANSVYEENKEAYGSIDNFVPTYLNQVYSLGLTVGGDWRSELRHFCKVSVLEKLIFYYVIREEGFVPTAEEHKAYYDLAVEERLLLEVSKFKEEIADLDADAYKIFMDKSRESVLEHYGERYFSEEAYYRFGTDKLIEFAKLS